MYMCGGGLLVASINAPYLFQLFLISFENIDQNAAHFENLISAYFYKYTVVWQIHMAFFLFFS